MSMNVFELFAKLGLDTSEYDSGLKGASSKLNSFADGITSGVGKAVAGVGAAMAGATAAVGAFTASAVQTGLSFDASMSKVGALSGATGEQMDILRDKAKEMGATTMFSATQAADAMGYMGMAGWKADQMVAGLPGIMSLAAASGEDLATTSDIVTDALTAFGLGAEQAGHFADVLAVASSNSNTNVAMMGETFKYVAPLAGTLGYSIEDISLAIGLMANSGIKASTAGTSLRSLFTRLAKQPKEAAAAMDMLGIKLDDGKGNMLAFRDVLTQIRSAFKNDLMIPADEAAQKFQEIEDKVANGELTQKQFEKEIENLQGRVFGAANAQMAKYAAMLAGTNGMSGFMAMLNASDEDLESLLNQIDHANGAATGMMDTMQDNLQGDVYIIKSAFEAVKLELSERLTPTLRNFTQLGSDTLSNIAKSTREKGIPGLIDGIVQAITVDLPAAIKKKLANKKLDILYSLFSTGSVGINNFITGLQKALGKLKDRLKDFTGSEKFQKFLEKLRELSEKMTAERVAILIEGIGTAILRLADAVVSFISSDKFMNFMESLGRWIDKQGPEGIADKIEGVAKALTALVVAAKALAAVQGVVSTLSAIGGAVKGLEALKGLDLAGKLGGLSSGLSGLGSSVAGLGSAASAVPTLMASDISLMGAATATEVGMTIGTTIAAGIAAAIAGYNGGKWGAWLVATLTGDIETAELYKNFNLAEGIKSLDNPNQGALEDAQDMFDGYVDMVTDFKENPVIAWLTTGVTVAGTGPLAPLILGFADFKKAAEDIDWNTIKDGVSSLGEDLSGAFDLYVQDISTFWSNVGNVIGTGLQNILTVQFNLLTAQIQFLWRNWGKSATEDAVGALNLMGQDIESFFLELADAEEDWFEPILLNASTKLDQFREDVAGGWELWKQDIYNGFLALGEYEAELVDPVVENILAKLTEFFENVRGGWELWKEDIYNGFLALGEYESELVTPTIEKIKEGFNNFLEDTKGGFQLWGQDIYDGLLELSTWWDDLWEGIKEGYGKFEAWLKENFKLPHLSMEGDWDLKNGKTPEIKIDWYAKAMDNAMILNGPTIFGASNGKLMGGGEAGSEVVSGTSTLMSMIQTAVASTQQPITVIMEMDDREFGRTVYQLNNAETQRVGVRLANV